MKFATKSQQHNRARPWWRAIHLRSKFLSNPVVWDFDSNLWATSSPGLFSFFKAKALGKRFISEATGKREKTFNLPCNIAGKKNCWKAMLLYLPLTFKPVLYQIRLLQVAWILTSDWIKLRGIHAIYGIYVTCCKKSLLSGSVCAACTDFVGKSRANLYFLQKRFVTCNNLVVARQVWLRGW